jgi:formylmethanofuran dehydrogenase subunit C
MRQVATPLVLTLRGRPDQRLDMSPLTPDRLARMSAAEIGKIALQTTRTPVTVADAFQLRMGDVSHIRIEDACDRLDQVGQAMTDGEIVVEGDVGAQAGRLMRGGKLIVRGNAGPWAGSGMRSRGPPAIISAVRLPARPSGCAAASLWSAAAPATGSAIACGGERSSWKGRAAPIRAAA